MRAASLRDLLDPRPSLGVMGWAGTKQLRGQRWGVRRNLSLHHPSPKARVTSQHPDAPEPPHRRSQAPGTLRGWVPTLRTQRKPQVGWTAHACSTSALWAAALAPGQRQAGAGAPGTRGLQQLGDGLRLPGKLSGVSCVPTQGPRWSSQRTGGRTAQQDAHLTLTPSWPQGAHGHLPPRSPSVNFAPSPRPVSPGQACSSQGTAAPGPPGGGTKPRPAGSSVEGALCGRSPRGPSGKGQLGRATHTRVSTCPAEVWGALACLCRTSPLPAPLVSSRVPVDSSRSLAALPPDSLQAAQLTAGGAGRENKRVRAGPVTSLPPASGPVPEA